MNQIKPYLFWIVAGVLLLVLLIGAVVTSPRGTIAGNTLDSVGVKAHLDTKVRDFKNLVQRARKGDPVGLPWDPVSDEQIQRLTNDYLLTTKWADAIKPNVEEYRKQLAAIQEDLVNRSKPLHEPVSTSRDLLTWFTAYQEQTGQFVAQLRDANCLVVPVDPTVRSGIRPGGGRTAGAGATTLGEEDPLDPATGAKIRDVVGLFTRTGPLPPAEEHALLTTRFRVIQALGRVVLASDVATRANPVVDPEQIVRRPAAIAALEWARGTDPLEGVTASYATYLRLSLTLHGTESALLATLAGLESLERPIAIVASSTLTRQDRLPAGARRVIGGDGEPAAPVAVLKVDLVVLDYSKMPDPTSESLQSLQQPQGIPAGYPGGLPGQFPSDMPAGMPPSDMPEQNFEGEQP